MWNRDNTQSINPNNTHLLARHYPNQNQTHLYHPYYTPHHPHQQPSSPLLPQPIHSRPHQGQN